MKRTGANGLKKKTDFSSDLYSGAVVGSSFFQRVKGSLMITICGCGSDPEGCGGHLRSQEWTACAPVDWRSEVAAFFYPRLALHPGYELRSAETCLPGASLRIFQQLEGVSFDVRRQG